MDINEQLAPLAYYVLFGHEPTQSVDPNNPANIPRLKAEQVARVDQMKKFWQGVGKPLMDRWQDRIKGNVNDLFVSPDEECTCKTCTKIREITGILRLLTEAELTLRQK